MDKNEKNGRKMARAQTKLDNNALKVTSTRELMKLLVNGNKLSDNVIVALWRNGIAFPKKGYEADRLKALQVQAKKCWEQRPRTHSKSTYSPHIPRLGVDNSNVVCC